MWVLILLQALAFFALPVIYRWYPVSSYCRGTFLDKITKNIYYVFYGCFYVIAMSLVVFCYIKVYRAIRQHNNAITPSLQDANGEINKRSRDQGLSRTICYCSWILRLLDSSNSNIFVSVWLPDYCSYHCSLALEETL